MNPKVKKLRKIKVPEQHTTGWFDQRKKCITASSASALLERTEPVMREYIADFGTGEHAVIDGKCCNPYSSRDEYLIEKCQDSTTSFKGSLATWWGNMFEPVANQIYSVRTGKEVLEFGLLPHPTLSWIGASPDGITPDGIMLEIKCPWRRIIKGVPPFYYWIQMQIQLEVCELEECDYFECTFDKYNYMDNEKAFLGDKLEAGEAKGVIIEVIDRSKPDPPHTYIYPPKALMEESGLLNPKNLAEESGSNNLMGSKLLVDWSRKTIALKTESSNGKFSYTPIFWKLIKCSIVRVKRHASWFERCKPLLYAGWESVLYHRQNGVDSLIAKKTKISKQITTTKQRNQNVVNIVAQLALLEKETKDDDSPEDKIVEQSENVCLIQESESETEQSESCETKFSFEQLPNTNMSPANILEKKQTSDVVDICLIVSDDSD